MFKVEITYPAKFGNLVANFSTSQTLATREDAETLKGHLKAMMPDLAETAVIIKNAPPSTVDEAMAAFLETFKSYPVLRR